MQSPLGTMCILVTLSSVSLWNHWLGWVRYQPSGCPAHSRARIGWEVAGILASLGLTLLPFIFPLSPGVTRNVASSGYKREILHSSSSQGGDNEN